MEKIDKKIILECIDDLNKRVGNCNCKHLSISKTHDDNYPSLTVWCAYSMFTQKIIVKYPPNDNDYNFAIFEMLELDSFDVSAKNDIENEKEKIRDYIERVKSKINLS